MTATPAPLQVPQRDVAIWRGDDDPPLVWEFGDATAPDILQGSTFLLIVQSPGYEVVLRSEDPATTLTVDVAARTVTWAYTQAESAALPQGTARYELKRVIANKTRTWVWGAVRVMSGLLHA
ncbi:MAG: hypothetical protein Q7T93_16720 [Methylobacterium sp.]|uniref:hypothetical protein n=1 Tax=Methylobacterium sp. TaxID=409 RepID=UPI002718B6BB|nr:hypothetical protein [Methylobacterium sp.]MDO9428462.1 hypothetical protein [Methylobacterium sp.]